MSQMRVNWRRVWRIAGPDRSALVRAMVFRLLQSFSLGVSFGTVLWVIRDLAAGREISTTWIWQVTSLAVLSLIGQLAFSFLSVRESWQASFRVCGALRQELLDHLLGLPLGSHLSRERGDLVNLISTDVDAIGTFLSDGLGRVVQAFALPAAILTAVGLQAPWLAAAMALTIAAGIPVFFLTSQRMARLGLTRQSQQGETSARVVEFVLGQPVLRAFGRQTEGNLRFRKSVDRLRDISLSLVTGLVAPVMIFIAILMLGIPITMLALAWGWDSLTEGMAISTLILAFAIYAPIIGLVGAMEMIRIAEASLLRIDALLDTSLTAEPEAPCVPQGHHIAFEAVSFSYDGISPVLQDLNFDVPERKVTAIVGASGSGKSTILHLIARFWDTDEGVITLGGVPLADLGTGVLMDQLSLVSQDVALFGGTVHDNIALARSGASREDVIAAARAAQAHGFITALPNGYDTEVGESGCDLSGGERQRVAIARAILKDAPIVLLDEATAAIDPVNERALQDALSALVRDRTLIVVAHKLGTIEAADQILVLDGGRLVEKGSHTQLVAAGGAYARLNARKVDALGWSLAS